MAKQEIPIKITVDTKGAQSEVEKLKKGVDDTGKSAKNAGDAAKKSTSFFGGLGSAIKGLGIVAVIAGAFKKDQTRRGSQRRGLGELPRR